MNHDVEHVTADDAEALLAERIGTSTPAALAQACEAVVNLRESEATKALANRFRHLSEALEETARRAREVWAPVITAFRDGFTERGSLNYRRVRVGGMESDLKRWPEQWVTYHCAGFVCGSCPSDRHDLRCNCPCHRKERHG
jgi:hypothetical protein